MAEPAHRRNDRDTGPHGMLTSAEVAGQRSHPGPALFVLGIVLMIASILEELTVVETQSVLSGKKHAHSRGRG